ncbi:MAG: LmeA family phospholipid-binding protein [bacterium]|nr:LmeA family phospholipid-binding protein [bacterium]
MKKFIIIIVFMFLLFALKAYCAQSEYDLYMQYCPKPPFDIADEGTRNFQAKTGLNSLAASTAAREIKKEIKKNAKGKFDVKVNSYSMTDAKQGKFKNFSVTGKKIEFSNIYITHLFAKTTCKFIHFDLEKNPVELLQPMAIDFEIQISEKDLNKTLQTPEYQSYTVGIKHQMVKISFFEFSNPRVSLKNNEFNFTSDVKTLMGKPFTANVISKLKIYDNKIILENLKFGSSNRKIEGKKMKYLLNIFDPIQYMQKALKQYNCKTLLKSVKIEDEKIIIRGSVFLGKS